MLCRNEVSQWSPQRGGGIVSFYLTYRGNAVPLSETSRNRDAGRVGGKAIKLQLSVHPRTRNLGMHCLVDSNRLVHWDSR
jgi:hypothetical protein